MNANEFRLGNLIEFNNFIDPPKTIFVNARFFASLAGGRSIEELNNSLDEEINQYYKPIPLTEEWLIKTGFVCVFAGSGDGMIFQKKRDGKIPIKLVGHRFPLFFDFSEHGSWQFGAKMEYVHQLQNLYFALTGEELKIDSCKEQNNGNPQPSCVTKNPIVEDKINSLLKVDKDKAFKLANRYNDIYGNSGVWLNYFPPKFRLMSLTFGL